MFIKANNLFIKILLMKRKVNVKKLQRTRKEVEIYQKSNLYCKAIKNFEIKNNVKHYIVEINNGEELIYLYRERALLLRNSLIAHVDFETIKDNLSYRTFKF